MEQTVHEVADLDGSIAGIDGVGLYLREIGKTPLLNAAEEVELAKNIEAGLYAGRVLTERADTLSEQESAELSAMADIGEASKQHFIQANLRLVVKLARSRKYKGSGMDLPELISHGNEGLIRAVEKFDYTKGFKFSTYSTWWVKQAIQRGVASDSRVVRLPIHISEKSDKVHNTEERLARDGIDPTPEMVGEVIGLDPNYIRDLHRWTRPVVSLDHPIDNGKGGRFEAGNTLLDFIAASSDNESIDEYEQVDNNQAYEQMHRNLKKLDSRTVDVLVSSFGINGGEQEKLKTIGERYDITVERTRQVRAAGLRRLRWLIEHEG